MVKCGKCGNNKSVTTGLGEFKCSHGISPHPEIDLSEGIFLSNKNSRYIMDVLIISAENGGKDMFNNVYVWNC